MTRFDGRKLPTCNVVHQKGKECMASRYINCEFKCTALKTTEYYWDECPFYVPKCEHRINGNFGFSKCKIVKFKKPDASKQTNSEGYIPDAPCPGQCCSFYKEVNSL